MNSIIIFWAICSFFIIIQFHCKNKCFLFYLQKSFGYLWDLWVIYEHLCSNLQFISLPEEVGEFLLYIMLNNFAKNFFFSKQCCCSTHWNVIAFMSFCFQSLNMFFSKQSFDFFALHSNISQFLLYLYFIFDIRQNILI